MPSAPAVVRRLGRVIARWGQPVSLTHSGVTSVIIARVFVLGNTAKFVYFRSAETANWANPAYTVTIAGDYVTGADGPAVGDTVELSPAGVAATFTVRKVDKPRLGSTVLKTVLYVARDLA